MARRLKDIKEIKIERPPRAKLSEKEILKRMAEFPKRKDYCLYPSGQELKSISPIFPSLRIKNCLRLSIENSPTLPSHYYFCAARATARSTQRPRDV